eukprot:3392526-Pyramimonas_sp.AAC.1
MPPPQYAGGVIPSLDGLANGIDGFGLPGRSEVHRYQAVGAFTSSDRGCDGTPRDKVFGPEKR